MASLRDINLKERGRTSLSGTLLSLEEPVPRHFSSRLPSEEESHAFEHF